MPKARILIVDDHALMCLGLRAILEPEYIVVGEVHDGESVPAAVVILTMHVERALAEHVIALGARAFVPKDARLAELRTAIDAARAGQRYISPRVPPRVEADAQRYPRGYLQLTLRERQIVRMIGVGLSSDRIAGELRISYHTVHFHRTNIRRKLGFHSEYEMNRFAVMVLQGDTPDEVRAPAGDPVRPLV